MSEMQLKYLHTIRRQKIIINLLRFLVGFIFVGIWEVAAYTGNINAFIFSSPSRIVNLFIEMCKDKTLFVHLGITIVETLISFLLVMLIGILAAIILWIFTSLSKILEPYLVMLGSLPKSALAPVLIVWLGNNMKTIIVAAVSVAVFGTIITLHNHFNEIDSDMSKLIRTLGGTRKDIMTKVLLPASIPIIISTMKVNIGLSLVGVIIGEFLAANKGLGYLIIYGSQVFMLDMVIMSIIILCILSMILYGVINLLEKKFTR
ncbi:MAG: ABC transporter permease [Lachnospiraceae bacterium]|nr:ABC transporter permease [Lachnospiraceae bacterium]